MSSISHLFETVSCPLCRGTDFDVLRSSKFPSSITLQELQQAFRASSGHRLMDQIVCCRDCSLVYINPRLKPDIITGGYSSAEDPAFIAQNTARIRTFKRTLRRIVKRFQLSAQGMRILDVGCAGGAFLVAARDLGFEAVGVEPSRWMADFGRRAYGVDIREGLLLPGMFPEQSFDMITLWDVIEHVPQPNEILALIHSLLRPSGLLLVNYPDIGSVAARGLGAKWPYWLSVHLLYYTRKTMAAQLDRTGFIPLHFEPCWQTLPAGYVARRATPYFRPARAVLRALEFLQLDQVAFTYNMGQTLVVSRRREGS